MCQMCEEADLYMAELQAAEKKAAELKARGDKPEKAGGKREQAPAGAAAK